MSKLPKILVVEDNEKVRESIVELLMNNKEPKYEVEDAASSDEARRIIKEFEPDVILLDLRIPRTREEEPEIRNAIDVLQEVTIHNYEKNADSKIIVISGSIDDPGLRRLIEGDRTSIITFINKNDGATVTGEFNKNVLKQVKRALSAEPSERPMEYSAIRKSIVRELKELNPELFARIDKEILDVFEKLNEKSTYVHKNSKDIVISCGEVVEDVISYMKSRSTKLSSVSYSKKPGTVRFRLNALTGREYDIDNKVYTLTGEVPLLTRPAAEYAFQAFYLSSEARHGGKDDDEANEKYYANRYVFTREDAAVSVNLIMPLVRDYINYLKAGLKK